MARYRPIAVQFDAAIAAAQLQTQADIAAFARREHAKVMKASPQPSSFRRFVDGREGAPEDSVKAFGVIEYHYQRLGEIVQAAMDALFDLSPVLSGDYRRAHTLFVGGVAVSNLQGWRPESGDEVYIANPLPYARKIELGKMTMRVPGTELVYAQAQQILRRRFGNLAAIKFSFVTVVDGVLHTGRHRSPDTRASKGGPARASSMPDQRRPALIIRSY